MKTKTSNLIIGIISCCIFSLILGLVYFNQTTDSSPSWTNYLPAFNALFNFITSIFLVLAIVHIKKKNIEAHKKYIFCALTSSFFFLIGYLVYHSLHGETKFIPLGFIRYTYFFLLISHIVLSFFQVPLILATLFYAYKKNYKSHKKIARWTFPIWLYVSVTGVIVFLFLNFLNN